MISLNSPLVLPAFSKIFAGTRDLTTASGSQSITGIGFRPSVIQLMAFVNGSQIKSDGWCDSALTQYTVFTGMNASAGSAYVVYGSGGLIGAFYTDSTLANNQVVAVSSVNNDGCVLNWTKTGSPTGTATFYFNFWR